MAGVGGKHRRRLEVESRTEKHRRRNRLTNSVGKRRKKKIITSFVTQGGVCTREPNPLVERMQIDSYCRKIGAYGGANECEWRKTRPGWSLHSRVTMDVLETSITMTSDERCRSESEIDWRQSTCVTFLL